MTTNVQSGTLPALTVGLRTQVGTTVTTAGVYVLKLDASAMANGDALTVEVETKVISGGTRHVTRREYFVNAQAVPNKQFIPEPEATEVAFFVTQSAGTGRPFDWAITSL